MSLQSDMPGIAAPDPGQELESPHNPPPQDSKMNVVGGNEHGSFSLVPRVTLAAEADAGIRDIANNLNQGPTKIIPKVRKCDVTHFKNRFSADDSLYAVDVLEAESTDIGLQMQDELKLRQNMPRKRARDKARVAKSAMPKPGSAGFHFGHSGRLWILRIRIHSPSILSILSKVITGGEETWDPSQPRTFFRPFSSLIFHHQRVCEVLAYLQERWGASDTLNPAETPASFAESDQDESGGRVVIDDCPQALADLRCYVKFMDEEVIALYKKFDNLSSDDIGQAKVLFHDLWYLFRVGELVHRPVGTGANKEHVNTALGNRTWRCYATRPFWARHRIVPSEHRSFTGEDDSDRASFGVHCYYIDYTGDEFCAVTETFEIPPFKGERPIKSLKVFPYRFAVNHRTLEASALKNGEKFLDSVKIGHAVYNGWTTTATPRGGPTTDVEGNAVKRPDFVDSEIIVDFVEAFQTCPAWKPEANIVKPEEPNPQTVLDDFTTCWWSDANRTKLIRETSEIIVLRTGVTTRERNNNLDPELDTADRFLVRIRENDRHGKPTTEADLCKDPNDPHCDLPLLPSRVFAYVLRDRKFVQVVVQQLKPVRISDDAFKYLKIDHQHKSIIQSLVEDHFQKKSSDRSGGVNISNFDLIKGKGKGLTMLLHGVPGVGKTATAEAIAAASGRPLFPITCGDLGLTPTEVESALLRIFRLADTWNCVLLLDEVDTFFSQRSKGDAMVAKNALVSVFLRVLEYYDGLLFLTTNRPGALDEAFSSRIHLAFYYPQLGFKQTMDIWEMNILRLENIERERYEKNNDVEPLKINRKQILRFAEGKYNEQCKTQRRQRGVRWNGRQIRNAFQIASSLAHYEARRDGTTPRLTLDHFKTIHTITEDFNRFMYETHGKTSSEQAFERGDRADHMEGRHADSDAEEEDRDPAAYDEEGFPRSPHLGRGGFGDGEPERRHRRHRSFDKPRSPSPNVAAAARAQQSRPQGSIFGVRGQPRSPRPQIERSRPAIEVTGAYSHVPRRDSDRGEGADSYLSPAATKNQEGWYGSGRGERRGRERSESDGQRKRRKPNSDSEDEDLS